MRIPRLGCIQKSQPQPHFHMRQNPTMPNTTTSPPPAPNAFTAHETCSQENHSQQPRKTHSHSHSTMRKPRRLRTPRGLHPSRALRPLNRSPPRLPTPLPHGGRCTWGTKLHPMDTGVLKLRAYAPECTMVNGDRGGLLRRNAGKG